MDSTVADVLLVLDMDSASATYGQVVGSVATGTTDGMPHHIERRVSADSRLLANGWRANTSWLFDLSTPSAPTIHASLQTAGGIIGWAHDFTRLPNGNLLVAFNGGPGAYVGAGGLGELDRDGAVVQAAVAKSSEAGDTAMTPYTVHPVPGRDRAVVGLGEMGMGKDYKYHDTSTLQFHRCLVRAHCHGGAGGASICAAHRGGPLCALCEPGYVSVTDSGDCQACPSRSEAWLRLARASWQRSARP